MGVSTALPQRIHPTYLLHRLQFLNGRSVERSCVGLEIANLELALHACAGVAIGTTSEVARVDAADFAVVRSDRCDVRLRLQLDDVLSRNEVVDSARCKRSSRCDERRRSSRKREDASEKLHRETKRT
jgi:hypothetical protein